MKQCITKKQWDEINYKKKFEFQIIVYGEFGSELIKRIKKDKSQVHFIRNWEKGGIIKIPTLGQIMEFLGDDIESITLMNGHWTLILIDETHFTDKELINVGWEAAKYKNIKK